MPLTPEDVSNKRFTAVRLREGYDMGEVDQFLDEVEAELTRLTKENDELRAKLESAGGEAPARQEPEKQPEPEEQPEQEKQTEPEPEEQAEPEPEPQEQPEPEPQEQPEPERQPEPEQPAPSAAREVETIQVTTTAEASRAATRLLELAGRNADELVSEAEQEADQILTAARAEAERAQQEAESAARKAEEDARKRAEELEQETTERRQHLMGDLESERARLDEEVTRLKQFEQTYRDELRGYFQQQLASLEGDGHAVSLEKGGSHEGSHSDS
jgi:DivIVA domain-containing protein